MGDRPGPVVGRRVRHRGRRQHALTRVEGERDAQDVAQRRRNEMHLAPAGGAQEMMCLERRPADQAAGRHDEIGDAREQ